MKRISPEEVRRWRLEIEQAEKFKDEEFGSVKSDDIKGAGCNIGYFERGHAFKDAEDRFTSLNVIYPITKNVIPTLYYKNPHILALPKRKQDEDSAPHASSILNYFFRELDLKRVNQEIIFDAYVLGMGVCKIGYATQFGSDIPDKNLMKDRRKKT